MRHFFVYPTAKPIEIGLPCAIAWKRLGYEMVVGIDDGVEADELIDSCRAALRLPSPFQGYYRIVNRIVSLAFECGADLVTVGGDDQLPPEQGAQWVADAYFSRYPTGEGVMQACGDPQGEIINGVHNAARICGSPTFGRGWLENGYKCGPFYDGYRSFYADEDLMNFAKRRDLLWMNPDITIDHAHWSFGRRPRQDYHERAEANWTADKELFEQRKAAGFPA